MFQFLPLKNLSTLQCEYVCLTSNQHLQHVCVVALGSYTNQYMLPHRVAISLCTDILYLYLGMSLCLQGALRTTKVLPRLGYDWHYIKQYCTDMKKDGFVEA